MDQTVLELAVPKLSADLEPTSSQLLWIMDIYGFLLAGFLITMGTLGDRIGRRRLLLIGAAAFGAASVLAAFSRSAEMLIATRAVLGIAGATLAPRAARGGLRRRGRLRGVRGGPARGPDPRHAQPLVHLAQGGARTRRTFLWFSVYVFDLLGYGSGTVIRCRSATISS